MKYIFSPGINGQDLMTVGNAPKLQDFLEDDVDYKNKENLIMALVKDNYEIMCLYSKRLNHVLDYYKWCCSYSIDEIKKLDGT